MPTSIEQFTKLMMMTTSPNDNEALTAIRKANAMLAASNNNWQDFIKGKVKMVSTYETQTDSDSSNKHTNAQEINMWFDEICSNPRTSLGFLDFIESVRSWWEQKGFLTDKQYEAIKSAYERIDDRWT